MPKIPERKRKRQIDLVTIAIGDPAPDLFYLLFVLTLRQRRHHVRNPGNTLEIAGQTYRVREVRAIGDGSECRATLTRL